VAAFEQLNPKVALQFFELPAELALPIRIVAGRGGDSACGHNLSERFQPFQRQPRLREKILEHDWPIIMVVFFTINKPAE
jgi:hypothetical protein